MSDSFDPVAEILASWKARQAEGATSSIDELCAEHPALAAEIRSRFAALVALGEHLRGAVPEPLARLNPIRAEHYAQFRPVGEGGMGVVYWAIDTDLNREVAFKVVRTLAGAPASSTPRAPLAMSPPPKGTPASAAFETLKARFLQEAWVTAGLSHPGIVPVYELGETSQGVPYYTMRFVKGDRTLSRAIDDVKGRPWEERLHLLEPFLKICDTLSYAHAQGVVHRDVKPENVALGEFGEVVLLDWGLAKIKDRQDVVGAAWQERIREFRAGAELRTLASALGTPGYMSPEAALGRVDDVDARSDVYSLGAILYRILVGRLPFESATFGELIRQLLNETPPPPDTLDPAVPAELSSLCLRALSRDAGARPGSTEAFAAEIRGWQTRRVLDREMDALLRDAKGAIEAASSLTGAATAAELDRAAAVIARALSLRPDDAAARSLSVEIATRREATMAARERAARGRALRRAATAALAVAAAGAVVVALVLEDRRRETAQARDDATHERDAKMIALDAERAARGRADAESRHARAYALAEAAGQPLQESPQLALLLARSSVRVEPTSEGLSRLHDALAACKERVRFDDARLDVEQVQARFAFFVGDGSRVVGGDVLGGVYLWTAGGKLVARADGHKAMLLTLSVCADGSRFVTGSRDRTARVAAADGTPVGILPAHREMVVSARLDRAGDRVVTLDPVRARLWEATGRLLAAVGDDANPPVGVDIAPDGRRFAAATKDGTLTVFDEAGTVIASRRVCGDAATVIRFAPDGSALLAAGRDGTIALVGPALEPVAEIRTPSSLTHVANDCGAAFSPDGTRFLAWGADETVQVRDRSGKELLRIPGEARQRRFRYGLPILAVFSPDGRRIAVSGLSGTIRVFTAEGRPLAVLRGPSMQPWSIEFSKDGRFLLSSAPGDGRVLWDIDGAEELVLPAGEGRGLISQLSQDGLRLLTSSQDGTRRVTDVASGAVRTLAPRAGEKFNVNARAPRLSPDGRLVVTAWKGAPPTVAAVAGGEPVGLLGHEGDVTDATFSTDGTLVATAGDDRTARLWRTDGEPLAVLAGHAAEVSRVIFAADGSLVATGSRDGEVRVFAPDGRQLGSWTDLNAEVHGLAFSPDGRRLAACSFRTSAVCVFDVRGGLLWAQRSVGRRRGMLSEVEWASDSRHLLTMNIGGATRVWRADGTLRATLLASEGGLLSSTFSPDGTLVASASDGPRAVVFDLDGHRLASLPAAEEFVQTVAFSPDGRLVVGASGDGSVVRWFVRTEDLLRLADERATRTFTRNEGARFEELFEEADRRRIRALRLVDEAAAAQVLVDETVESLVALSGVDDDDRRVAVEIARSRAEEPITVVHAAWELVAEPGASAAQLAQALRWAEVGARVSPDSEYVQSCLGACLYRLGRMNEALDALLRADAIARTGGSGGVVDASVFLAMVHAARGDVSDAELRLAEARALAQAPRTQAHTKKLVEEAATRVEEARSKR